MNYERTASKFARRDPWAHDRDQAHGVTLGTHPETREDQRFDDYFGPPNPHHRDANLDWYDDPELDAVLIRLSAEPQARVNVRSHGETYRGRGRPRSGDERASWQQRKPPPDPYEVSKAVTARCYKHHMDESGFDHEVHDARFLTAIIRFKREGERV